MNAGTRLLRLYTGNRTDPAYNATYRTLKRLDRIRIRHQFDGVNPDAGGNRTDFTHDITMSTMATFDRPGIEYDFAGVTTGPHGWDTWQKNLIGLAPRLFRPGTT